MGNRLKAFQAFLNRYWLPFAIYGGVLLAFGWLLWWQLGTLTSGYSSSELAALQASDSLKDIFHNPVNAPFTVAGRVLLYLEQNGLHMMRVVATLVGLVTITTFYWLVRYWHGQRAAILGSIIFGTSAWFLHTSRLGTPEVLMFGLLTLTACSVWFKHSQHRSLPVVLLLVLAASLLYVPGMIWFILAGVIWQWKTIDRIFKKHLWMVTVGAALLLAILAPLGLAIYHDPNLAKVMVGLPANGWPEPLVALKSIAEIPLQLVFRGPDAPETWLGRVAVLDAFALAMLFLGIYVYLKHARLVRTQLVGVILLIGTGLAGLGGAVTLSILVPFVYIVIAAGIGLMLDRWYTVFPRNPIAQTVGVGLVSLAVLASAWYGYRHYFVAWPNAPATKAVFTVPPSAGSATIKE
jgi:hypothetical protein